MSNRAGMLMPLFVVGAVLMMVIPVSPVVLDLLLTLNIAFAVLVLLSVVTLKDTLDLTVFPALLLIMTLARLALNVSSTRLILLDGYAGRVIETFGGFVVGGSVIVGLVVFLILIVIQFAVVTNGAGRVAEVAARFTLDALPGKQMAIDADLSAGLLDEAEARDKRERIATEADFYGAMDGASKFVKGDVLAGVIIVLINLFGGFVIGLGNGLSISEAVSTYTLLTVGDGLVSQIPALLTSIAAGLLITRVGNNRDLGAEVAQQLFRARRALRLSSYVIGGLGLFPGLPKISFLTVAVTLFVLSTRVPQPTDEAELPDEVPAVELDPNDPEAIIGAMRIEPLELHLAYDTLDLIDEDRGGDLLDRVKALRRQIAQELGFVMPLVRTRDDVGLPSGGYAVQLEGVRAAEATAPRDHVMALPAGDGSELRALGGSETVEPVFGLVAYWMPEHAKEQAAASGATVVDRSSVIVTHLADVVRVNAARLLQRQDVHLLVDGLRYDHPVLAKDVDEDVVPIGTLHEVLRSLLEEGVSIRQLASIVETLSAHAGMARPELVARARAALGPSIVNSVVSGRKLGAVTFEPTFEVELHDSLREVDGEQLLVLGPGEAEQLIGRLDEVAQPVDPALVAVVVCGASLRRPLRKFLLGHGLDIPVLAYAEISEGVDLVGLAVVDGGSEQISAPPAIDLVGQPSVAPVVPVSTSVDGRI
jgi:flagellar biosynthesis protein FlhA